VRRAELARLGVQLPVLPTVALGGLPGGAGWAARLERIGLDVVASGAAPDTAATWSGARAEVPHRPVKGVAGDAAALRAAGCLVVEADGPVEGAYRLGPDEAGVDAVRADDLAVEDPNDVAARIVEAFAHRAPAALWCFATPGLERLDTAVVEAKLLALVDGARLARLWLAKHQFGPD
jgi:hypothetical protein